MSELVIRGLYEKRLIDWADTNDLEVATENDEFDPPIDASVYLRIFLLPARIDSLDLAGEHTLFQGVCQIDIVTQRGVGANAAGLIVPQLRDLFRLNLQLTAPDGFMVQIVSPLGPTSGLQNASRYIVPTSFTYRADAT
jgi:hypothetical protein